MWFFKFGLQITELHPVKVGVKIHFLHVHPWDRKVAQFQFSDEPSNLYERVCLSLRPCLYFHMSVCPPVRYHWRKTAKNGNLCLDQHGSHVLIHETRMSLPDRACLNASSHHYKRVGLCVPPSFCPSICPSLRLYEDDHDGGAWYPALRSEWNE